MPSPACSICTADDPADLETLGLQAEMGEISWREAARRGGLSHAQGLRNHMEKHYHPPEGVLDPAEDELARELLRLEGELLEQMALSPVEIRPLYAVAVRNLRGLLDTKPSQQNLVAALKAIHEITGMKMGQQMLLQFARAHFGPGTQPASIQQSKGEVIDITTRALERSGT